MWSLNFFENTTDVSYIIRIWPIVCSIIEVNYCVNIAGSEPMHILWRSWSSSGLPWCQVGSIKNAENLLSDFEHCKYPDCWERKNGGRCGNWTHESRVKRPFPNHSGYRPLVIIGRPERLRSPCARVKSPLSPLGWLYASGPNSIQRKADLMDKSILFRSLVQTLSASSPWHWFLRRSQWPEYPEQGGHQKPTTYGIATEPLRRTWSLHDVSWLYESDRQAPK